MAIVTISERYPSPSQEPSWPLGEAAEQALAWCAQLESGDILYFPRTPVLLPAEDLAFLLGQQQADSSLHKNIAYKPALDLLSGVDTRSRGPSGCRAAARGDARLFRGCGEGPRRLSIALPETVAAGITRVFGRRRKRVATCLRASATTCCTPMPFRHGRRRGARILRFFTNIHPERTRDWVVGEPFRAMVGRFAPGEIAPRPASAAGAAIKGAGAKLGLGAVLPSIKRTPYDDFMMRFHNFLKENARFQAESEKYPFQFPAGSSWMVFTDTVPHAVLGGQYALEQTLLVEPAALVAPEHAPLTVLEGIAGTRLV